MGWCDGSGGGGSNPDPSGVTYVLGSSDIADFLQVIGVIDQDADETRMYVNGLPAGTPVPNATNDWSGINASGLGVVGENATGGYTGNPSGHTTYVGDIAIFNFYQYALSDAEAWLAFRSVAVPEPATMLVWSLLAVLGIGAGWWRRKR